METKSPPDSWTNRVRGFHLLTIDQTNRNAWTPSHKQIKRARKAAPPWHPELAKRAAKKRAQRFAFSPPKLTLGSYEDGDACCRESGRFWTEDRRLWEFWKEELVRNETGMERNGWIREAREGNERGVSVKFRSVAAPAALPGWRVLGCW